MSHSVVYVIVPENTVAVYPEVERLLAPFDESLEVQPYIERCSCVGMRAHQEAREAADRECGSIDELRESFRKLDVPEDAREAAWKQHIAAHVAAELRAFESHPLKDAPDPGCSYSDGSGCKGTGTVTTTYNPKSRWDWWRVGGRWDGYIQGEERPSSDGGFNFGEEHEDLRNNIIRGDALKLAMRNRERIPFAVLTPDGEWHEQGRMGWWGVVHEEKETDWPEEATELVAKHGKCWVVAVDVHI